jgi:DNA-binding LacI/PurR family transcriptional regulator
MTVTLSCAALHNPQLTVVDPAPWEFGREAAHMLERILAQPDANRQPIEQSHDVTVRYADYLSTR